MRRRLSFLLVISAASSLLACGTDSSVQRLAAPRGVVSSRAAAPSGFTIYPAGFTATLVADGLTAAQGADQQGNGVLFVTEAYRAAVTRVLPSGQTSSLAEFTPSLAGVGGTVLDLMIDSTWGMLVSSLRYGKVYHVGFNGDTTDFVTGLVTPTFMATDGAHSLYIVEPTRRILRVDADHLTTVIRTASPAARFRGIAFDGEHLYAVINQGSPLGRTELRRFDLDGATLPFTSAQGTLITSALPLSASSRETAQDLAVWPAGGGDLFIAYPTELWRVSREGNATRFASGLQGPFNALAVTADGQLLVTDYGTETLAGAGRVIRIRAR